MHTIHEKKDSTRTATVRVDPTKVIKGHQPRQSGAGVHRNKSDKRCRSGKLKSKRAIMEFR